MSHYKRNFLEFISTLTSNEFSKQLLKEQDLNASFYITVLTSAGTFTGKVKYPENVDFPSDPLGYLWANNLQNNPRISSDIDNDGEINSIWLEDAINLETEAKFSRLVLFVEDIVGVSMSGNIG